jgi:ligand-binding SRPBCC domain-containing protein
MARIHLTTRIKAPLKRCFDLSRSIDLHKISTKHSNEEAVDGVLTGLIGLNETVTWRAKHFGIWQKLTSEITEMEPPHYFVDTMVKGPFKAIKHRHTFKPEGNFTIMEDDFYYSSPFGILGAIIDKFILKKYLTSLLENRNLVIKEYAESENWKSILIL